MPWQPAAILYPDAELTVIDGLRPLLAAAGETDVHLNRVVPNPRKPRMVVVTRDGGNAANLIDRPRLRVRVWDQTSQRANDLARLVVALMPRLADGDPITRVLHLSGPYEVPDEAEQEQRYLMFEIHTTGAQL